MTMNFFTYKIDNIRAKNMQPPTTVLHQAVYCLLEEKFDSFIAIGEKEF